MSDFITKQSDTGNYLEAQLIEDGVVLDLTDCTVAFKMGKDDTTIVDKQAVIQNAIEGIVVVPFSISDLSTTGKFEGEFVVEYPSTEKESFPNRSYIDIEIKKSY